MLGELKVCPICKIEPAVGYVCGDYFAYCSDGCPSPMCDHVSEAATINEWNRWAKWFRNWRSRTQPEPVALTVPDDVMNAAESLFQAYSVYGERVGSYISGFWRAWDGWINDRKPKEE